MTLHRAGLAAALAALLGCAPGGAAQAPAPVSAAPATHPAVPIARADGAAVRRSADPAVALARGWMPLASTGVPEFRSAHPTYDGRGVLIAVLDSGIDPAVEGLGTTSDGSPKVLELRDFSREGRVMLKPLDASADTLTTSPRLLAGGAALRALSPAGPWFVGVVAERPLGSPPAADLNGDGDNADSLVVVVARDSAGWFLLADTDLDRSIADEQPVRDYAVAREWFGWARPGAPQRHGIAVNLAEQGGAPVLDLFFDTSGHGTHVAGIAAGHRIYGTAGLDGVAPGAQLLGLKIANNARGGISTTGSMLAAMDHAIRFARARRMPLVMNLSFGVGNEREGAARIDAIVDSVLAAHPDVVFTISAGNDGPGLSTLGFPGSASRAISVGASLPAAFLPAEARGNGETAAYFSARGGQLAKPDLIAPGVAYSTVPRWNAGEEQAGGTSMAAPHAAGLAALLVSGLVQEERPVRAADLRAALMATATRTAELPWFAEGAGLARIGAAWEWLAAGRRPPELQVRAAGGPGAAAFHEVPAGGALPAGQRFEIVRPRGAAREVYRLRSDRPWLLAPDSVVLSGTSTAVVVRYDTTALADPGVRGGSVTAWAPDSAAGPAFRLDNAVVVPHPGGQTVRASTGVLAPAGVGRVVFRADTGRAFAVTVVASGATAFLHEPGGRPYRGGQVRMARSPAQPATFEVDAADVVGGTYEVAVVAPPTRTASAEVAVRHAPVRFGLHVAEDAIEAELTAVGPDSVSGDALLLLVGGERRLTVRGEAAERTVPIDIPAWASSAAVDVRHPGGQWERFTDFGVTLLGEDGTILEQSPMNYAFGRLSFEVPPSRAGRPAVLSLLPGLADPVPAEPWTVEVAIRFYAATPVSVAPTGGAAPLTLAPGGTVRYQYPLTDSPWPLAAGFHPLAVLVAETGGAIWSREAGLAGAAVSGE